ncbi:serine/threonine protein kinase [Corallococcus sp. CA047B]|uniref:serine/threonine protein kinase n=1 Tax=Corallococcus sp. CA047B TaxID=2316729 RepID=UPI000EA0CF1E|nr:serine/threonine-protein kinase [Corallococcus sp. CA047B]RKH14382.1 serine/threonine protein kinase [Corallococcus sp. CA047B]
MALQAGDVFGRYELVSWLGRGGMAETWRAQLVGDAGVTKPVLIKKVLPEYADDEAFISMFISEARISATLSHGNVAQVFDFGRVDGEYFLAMEFVDGQPLHRVLKRAMKSGLAALPVPLAVFIAMEMCRGLHYAHTRTNGSGKPLGIVHRDISPDNVLVGYEGQVKIVDFGIAKAQLLRGFKTAPGVVKGKYLFFSPEQARGEDVDARSDVWATGVVLYELLCGKLPVEGPPHVVMMRVEHGEIPAPNLLRPDLPKELNDIVMKALTPDRNQRFESSHAFGDALAGFLYSNFPRFSAMTVANLLRVLFRSDLAQEGRELSVPGSFLEEMKSWQGAAAPEAPVEKTPAPLEVEAPAGLSRRWVQALSAGGLLTVGACFWLVMAPLSPPPRAVAPPAIPIQPHSRPSPADSEPSPEPAGTSAPQDKEADEVSGMAKYVHEASDKEQIEAAIDMANLCKEKYPSNPECADLLRIALSKSAISRLERQPGGNLPRARINGSRVPLAVNMGTNMPIQELQARVSTLNQQGKTMGALALAQTCVERAPSAYECHLMLGVLYGKLMAFEKSKKHYERFLGLAPPDHPKRARVAQIVDSVSKTPSATDTPR